MTRLVTALQCVGELLTFRAFCAAIALLVFLFMLVPNLPAILEKLI